MSRNTRIALAVMIALLFVFAAISLGMTVFRVINQPKGATLQVNGEMFDISRSSSIVIQSHNEIQAWSDVTVTARTVTVTIYMNP